MYLEGTVVGKAQRTDATGRFVHDLCTRGSGAL